MRLRKDGAPGFVGGSEWWFCAALLDAADGPEVRGEAGAGEVGVGHAEVAFLTPGGGPGVADDELLVLVVVSDAEDGVTSYDLLSRRRHGKDASLGDLCAFEGLVCGEAEDEGITGGETAFERIEVLDEALVEKDDVRLGVVVGLDRGLLGELRDVVGPVGLGRDTLSGDGLDAVTDLSAGVSGDSAFDDALV